jgi:hypothetical protein
MQVTDIESINVIFEYGQFAVFNNGQSKHVDSHTLRMLDTSQNNATCPFETERTNVTVRVMKKKNEKKTMKRKYREQDKEREMKMKTVKEDRTMKWWT